MSLGNRNRPPDSVGPIVFWYNKESYARKRPFIQAGSNIGRILLDARKKCKARAGMTPMAVAGIRKNGLSSSILHF